MEISLFKSSKNTNNLNQTAGDYNARVLSGGIEAGGVALMGRAQLVEATVYTGRVGINMGVQVDTGVKFGRKEMEVKILGVGFRGKDDEIQICVFVCFGIIW